MTFMEAVADAEETGRVFTRAGFRGATSFWIWALTYDLHVERFGGGADHTYDYCSLRHGHRRELKPHQRWYRVRTNVLPVKDLKANDWEMVEPPEGFLDAGLNAWEPK